MYLNRKDECILEWRKLLKVDPKNRDAALNLSSLLLAADKSTDALVVLESAVRQSPGSPSLEMALGEAYVKSGDADKGIPHMNEAMKNEADPKALDPGMLNDAAYLLAMNNTHLDQARLFAEKAIAE